MVFCLILLVCMLSFCKLVSLLSFDGFHLVFFPDEVREEEERLINGKDRGTVNKFLTSKRNQSLHVTLLSLLCPKQTVSKLHHAHDQVFVLCMSHVVLLSDL